MKAEEIKNKTNEAVAYLVEALQSGQSEVLTEYLNAMARFHNWKNPHSQEVERPSEVLRKAKVTDESQASGNDHRTCDSPAALATCFSRLTD
jgi:DNA-binding phage protein